MSISLHHFTVRSFDQALAATASVLEKGRVHCEAQGIDLADVVATRLYEDMRPFHFQVVSVWHHSLGAMRGVEAGAFSPPPQKDLDYEGLQALVEEARSGLGVYSPERVEAFRGKDVVFKLGENQIPFVAEDFLASFSLPNFYFHATTTYDILRPQGVPIGKRDSLGPLASKR